MRGSGPAEVLDKDALLAGVLIGERGNDAARAEDGLHPLETAALGDDLLAGPAAKAPQESMEVRIIERAGHGVGAEAEQAERPAAHLPVAEMAGEQEDR